MLSPLLCAVALGSGTTHKDLLVLKKGLDAISNAVRGRMGYCLTLLKSGDHISLRGEEQFPTASTGKVAIAVQAVRQVDEGKLKWSDTRVVPPLEGRQEGPWGYFFKDGVAPTLDAWVTLNITWSDNTATMVLRPWLGVDNINKMLEDFGLHKTRVLWDGFTPEQTELRAMRDKWGLGVTTPNEMNHLLKLIYERKAASPAACDRLLRTLSMQYYDDLIGATVPVGVKVASKSGAIGDTRSDVAVVFSPTEPYILTIYTGDLKDTRWEPDNEGRLAIRRAAQLVWNTLHPRDPYQPPIGWEKFMATGGGL